MRIPVDNGGGEYLGRSGDDDLLQRRRAGSKPGGGTIVAGVDGAVRRLASQLVLIAFGAADVEGTCGGALAGEGLGRLGPRMGKTRWEEAPEEA